MAIDEDQAKYAQVRDVPPSTSIDVAMAMAKQPTELEVERRESLELATT